MRHDADVVMDHKETNYKDAIMKTLITLIFSTLLLVSSNFVFAGPVNINTADATTLAANIKGIGQKKAEAIIAYRDQHGAFSRAEDLAKVRGIGLKTIEKNRDYIKVE